MSELNIKSKIKLSGKESDVILAVPGEHVSTENPYKLKIEQENERIIAVAIGGEDKDKNKNILLSFSPPPSLFPKNSSIEIESLTLSYKAGDFQKNDPFKESEKPDKP